MKIRKAKVEDCRRISNLIYNTTDLNLSKDSLKHRIAWKKFNTPSRIKERLKERIIFCAFENNILVGTISLKNDEIGYFYINHKMIGNGIGSKILNYLEKYAIKKGIKKIWLTSTPAGYEFYKRKGFKPGKKIDVKVLDVVFTETKMVKKLS